MEEIIKCSICGNDIDDDKTIEREKYGIVCNSCDCNLLEIENNVYCNVTEEEFVNSFK